MLEFSDDCGLLRLEPKPQPRGATDERLDAIEIDGEHPWMINAVTTPPSSGVRPVRVVSHTRER